MNTSQIFTAIAVLAAVASCGSSVSAQQTQTRSSTQRAPASLSGTYHQGFNSTSEYHDLAVAHHGERRRGHWHPPTEGRMVRGHWTPWNPPDPATYPADYPRHTIVKGDTLWDIAAQYYKDPLLWPFLWEYNDWILDPEWIYPGDVLLVGPLHVVGPGSPSRAPASALASIDKGFSRTAKYNDLYCGHFVRKKNRKPFGEIVETEADPTWLTATIGDVVYIDVGSKDGVLPGDEFAIVYPQTHIASTVDQRERLNWELVHPITSKHMGVITKMSGRLRVILLGEEVSTAQIVYACDSIEIGFDIHPFTEVPIPLTRRHESQRHVLDVADRGRGFVAWVEGNYAASTKGNLVTIDLGSDQGVLPGDVFTVFRNFEHDVTALDNDFLGKFWDRREGLNKVRRKRTHDERGIFFDQRKIHDTPPRIIGELVVLYTERHSATAKVLQTRLEVVPGDLIAYAGADRELIVEHTAVDTSTSRGAQ
ncbi:MAG: LysM peptidoglycan-binding domain-containing protein [Acidobacteriota bacterium]